VGDKKEYMNIEFKNDKVFRNFFKVAHHPILIEYESWFINEFGFFVVTSAFREGDNGVHGTVPLRGFDSRHWVYNVKPEVIEKVVNDNWIYDPLRPHKKVCWLHDAGKSKNMHFHNQIHPNTIRR
jgi:hypothetical protein